MCTSVPQHDRQTSVRAPGDRIRKKRPRPAETSTGMNACEPSQCENNEGQETHRTQRPVLPPYQYDYSQRWPLQRRFTDALISLVHRLRAAGGQEKALPTRVFYADCTQNRRFDKHDSLMKWECGFLIYQFQVTYLFRHVITLGGRGLGGRGAARRNSEWTTFLGFRSRELPRKKSDAESS